MDRLALRKEELAAKAAEGSRQAALRILHERRKLWFEMQVSPRISPLKYSFFNNITLTIYMWVLYYLPCDLFY